MIYIKIFDKKMSQSKWFIKQSTKIRFFSDNKKITFKTSMLRSDLCDYSDVYIVVKGRIIATGTNAANKSNKKLTLRIMLCLDHAYQKLITHSQTMQKILILLCRWIIWQNIVAIIIEITEMILLIKIMMQIIIEQIATKQQQINILSIRQN